MAPKQHPPGPPMTLDNMRELGVQHLIATASTTPVVTPDEIEIPLWRAKRSGCGGKRVDVRPNRKQKPGNAQSWQGRSAEASYKKKATPFGLIRAARSSCPSKVAMPWSGLRHNHANAEA
jgi:hypothetical protein